MRRESGSPDPTRDRANRPLVSPDDQGTTFIELFFDLVFAFAITRITHYATHTLMRSASCARC